MLKGWSLGYGRAGSGTEEADLHRTYIGSVERGERNVGVRNIIRLAIALEVDPCDLVGGLVDKRR